MDLSITTDEEVWHWRRFWALLSLDMAEPFLPAFALSRQAAADLRVPARYFTENAIKAMAPDGSIDRREMQALVIACFGRIKAKFELPLAERVRMIALRDFPHVSDRHVASAWLTIALPMVTKTQSARDIGIVEATKQRLEVALAEYNRAMLPWNRLLEDAEAVTPTTAWDVELCSPGSFYGNPREEFRPIDWLWDAIRWVHFRELWLRIEGQFSAEEIQSLLHWASQILVERGLPEAQIPKF